MNNFIEMDRLMEMLRNFANISTGMNRDQCEIYFVNMLDIILDIMEEIMIDETCERIESGEIVDIGIVFMNFIELRRYFVNYKMSFLTREE